MVTIHHGKVGVVDACSGAPERTKVNGVSHDVFPELHDVIPFQDVATPEMGRVLGLGGPAHGY